MQIYLYSLRLIEILHYLCSVKAAIKRAKSREFAFELFRAKADSNEVQTLNNENYGSNDNDIHRHAVGKTRAVRGDAPCSQTA